MSWNFNGVGKPVAVAKKAKDDLARIKCAEPEESLKAKIGEIIDTAVGSFPADVAVKIEAAGSQWSPSGQGFINSLTLKIEPLYGFVE